MQIILCFTVAILPTALSINWQDAGDVTWSLNCDFFGDDLDSVKTTSEKCGPTCEAKLSCSHFTWTNFEGGTCFLKQGQTTPQMAKAKDDEGAVCGYIKSRISANMGITWQEDHDVKWAKNCDFFGNDLDTVKTSSEKCGPACVDKSDCTHFTWTNPDGGTCWLKRNKVNQQMAVEKTDMETICGFVKSRNEGPITKPPNKYIRGCYYTGWAQYREGKGKYLPENYESGLCTHIFYAFVLMNSDFSIKATNEDEQILRKLIEFKNKQTELKVLASFGGGTFSTANKTLIKSMTSSQSNRNSFINSALDFVKKFNLDGLDVDWEFPEEGDKQNFVQLIKDLSAKFHSTGLFVTAAVSAAKYQLDKGYDVPSIAPHLDFINLMTYDFHGPWENGTGFNSPLFDRNGDKGSVNDGAEYWVSRGTPKSKLIIGFPTYGRSWTLNNVDQHDVGRPASIGQAGPITKEKGILAYYEILDVLQSGGKRQVDNGQKSAYVIKGDQWISYDNEESFNIKSTWLRDSGFGGAFIWTLDLDDFTGTSSGGQKYPLMKTINHILSE